MRCDEALDRMLEVDPGELTAALAGTDADEATELTAHVRSCERCAAVARTLRAELRSLDAGLEALAQGTGRTAAGAEPVGAAPDAETGAVAEAAAAAANAAADAALAAVRSDADSKVAPGQRHGDTGATDRGRWTRRAWIPLAAAAALVGVLVLGQDPPLPPSDATARTATIDPRVSVAPPADRGAAIMETENPNITIVWLYEREES